MPVYPGSGVGTTGSSTTVVGKLPPCTMPVGIRPFQRKPEPVVIRIFTVRVVVETGLVVVTITSFSSLDVVITPGVIFCGELPEPLFCTFSRPMLARTFSEGVMGNKIKNARIIAVRRINPRQDTIVTLVDLLRFEIKPDLLLIKSPFFREFLESHVLLLYSIFPYMSSGK